MKTVIRSKSESKQKLPKKVRANTNKPKKVSDASSKIPASERRRSGRATRVSNYTDTKDSDDEAEMLDGVAKWKYGENDSDDDDEDEDSGEEQSEEEEEEDESEDEPAPPPKSNGKGQLKSAGVKASVLSQLKRGSTGRRGRKGDDEDMEVDD